MPTMDLGSASPFENGNALFESSKTLFEFGGWVAAENTLSEHRLLHAIESFLNQPK
jgi:hypothetical protein